MVLQFEPAMRLCQRTCRVGTAHQFGLHFAIEEVGNAHPTNATGANDRVVRQSLALRRQNAALFETRAFDFC